MRVGLVRAYSTRHDAGPFVPEDAAMTARLLDPYNPPGDWQGAMRCGPFDFVATRYAMTVNAGLDWLAIGHLDCLDRLDGFTQGWPFCRRYLHDGATQAALASYDDAGWIADLRLTPRPDLAHQERLTGLLMQCAPVVEHVDPREVLDLVEQETGRPVGLCAWGPTAVDRARARRPPGHQAAGRAILAARVHDPTPATAATAATAVTAFSAIQPCTGRGRNAGAYPLLQHA